jgi:hypothetical protein
MSKLISETDIGDSVRCDWCGTEYRGDPTSGGFLFQSKATCPTCALRMMADIDKFGERRFIRSRCPTHLSFHAWVMQLRGGDNRVQVIEYERGEMPHEQL